VKELDEYESAMLVDDESRVSKLPGHREREWTLKVDVENSRLGVGSVHGA